jgi:hypothetical protein
MPISKKIFSKKRVKKSVRKNTRKHKKRTPDRKNRKSGKQFRFIGGDGDDKNCPICFLPLTDGDLFTTNCRPIPHKFHSVCIQAWCSGKAVCPCPLCRTTLIPNPNPLLPPPPPPVLPPPPPVLPLLPPVVVDNYRLFRVEFFTFVNNPQTGEIDRVPVRVQDISRRERSDIIAYLVTEFDGLGFYNIRFNGEHEDNPYGYIVLGDNPYNVIVREGDIYHIFLFNDPEHVSNVTSLRITRM